MNVIRCMLSTSSRRFTGGLVSRNTSSYALIFKSFGDPAEVVEKIETTKDVLDKTLSSGQVRLKFLASPVNPADINTIQGVYGVKPPLPHFAGNEGVAEVIEVGPDVTKLSAGDWVIPADGGTGTWKTHSLAVEDLLIKIPGKPGGNLDIFAAASLCVNPPTAYRMLRDYVALTSGDCIVQNGANSSVGSTVIQLCKAWGIQSINVIRSRADGSHKQVERELIDLGATVVLTEEQLRDKETISSLSKRLPKAKLALNCVGGKSAVDCLRLMAFQSTMVTYGAMSKQPLPIPAGPLIFQDMRFLGYWNTRWFKGRKTDDPERIKMMTDLTDMYRLKKLKAAKTVSFSLNNFKEALKTATNNAFNEGKVVFVSE